MKQKSLFMQAIPFALMLAVLSSSRLILEFRYSQTSYVITTALACALSIIIMAAALIKFCKAKSYFVSALSVAAILFLLAKLIIAIFSIRLDFDFPLSTFEIIYILLLVYFFVAGLIKKNIMCLCLTFLATASYLIMWVLPNAFVSLRNSVGFNTYFNSHELFVILFGWIILLIVSVVSHLFYKGNKENA